MPICNEFVTLFDLKWNVMASMLQIVVNMVFSHKILWLPMMAIVAGALGCSSKGTKPAEEGTANAVSIEPKMAFNTDSAYAYIKQQVSFGPRVPGTTGHSRCADWIVGELKRHNADTVIEQKSEVTAYTGDRLPINNIMARYNVASPRRVLLLAHWDTRPWADQDDNEENRHRPIDGANDGGSGVGVLLELARNFGKVRPDIGVDLLFVDAEDYGRAEGFSNNNETWCLGTQYWTENMPYGDGALPEYAVCLDMVGGIDAVFHREFISNVKARSVVDKVWKIASQSGYGAKFNNDVGGSIVDDHLFINNAGIPAIVIVESTNPQTRSFPPTWHTMSDNMQNIDKTSLKAVGQTVTNLIYQEK